MKLKIVTAAIAIIALASCAGTSPAPVAKTVTSPKTTNAPFVSKYKVGQNPQGVSIEYLFVGGRSPFSGSGNYTVTGF